jgi:hypothetical protein
MYVFVIAWHCHKAKVGATFVFISSQIANPGNLSRGCNHDVQPSQKDLGSMVDPLNNRSLARLHSFAGSGRVAPNQHRNSGTVQPVYGLFCVPSPFLLRKEIV